MWALWDALENVRTTRGIRTLGVAWEELKTKSEGIK